MPTRVPGVALPVVCVHALALPESYGSFAHFLLRILWAEYREECSLLIDRRNPMLRDYLERFASEEAYQFEYFDFEEQAIIGKADLYVLLTKATDGSSHDRLRMYRANGIRTVVIIQ